MEKLKSRKLWLTVAAFLGSLGVSIAGLSTSSEIVAAIGIVCAMLSAAIYAACEAWVDAAREEASEEITYANEVKIEEKEED